MVISKSRVAMNKLTNKKRAQVVKCLVEGMSIRVTTRITGVAKNTVIKLLTDLGDACWEYQDKTFRDLSCKRIQVDEIWSFVYAKQRNVPEEFRGTFGYGDVWTWTAIDADTKLIPSWFVGSRNADAAWAFMHDLAGRLSNRVQLTSDGHGAYLDAVDWAFESNIDYAQLIKRYGQSPEGTRRYSPPRFVRADARAVMGKPKAEHISTSFVERQNLTMRMHMRRFTRLTNAFSKKVENLSAAVSLHFMFYNFAKVHQTLRVTPAMEAGLTDHIWTVEEILAIMPERKPGKRGPYKKRNNSN